MALCCKRVRRTSSLSEMFFKHPAAKSNVTSSCDGSRKVITLNKRPELHKHLPLLVLPIRLVSDAKTSSFLLSLLIEYRVLHIVVKVGSEVVV